jgi:hypothetical protein
MTDLPDYDDLLARDGFPRGSAWGLWGPEDRLGCLNLLTSDRVAAGVASVRDNEVFSLNWELEQPSPPLFGRASLRHDLLTWPTGGHDDELHQLNTQSSSQWDGFRHMRHTTHGFFGGLADEQHGIEWWARRGIVGRAVLVDMERWREAQGRPVRRDRYDAFTAAEMLEAIDAQGSTVEPGDILVLYTGWIAWYRSLDESARAALAAGGSNFYSFGIAPGDDTVRALWNLHPAAVVSDNTSVEALPTGGGRSAEEVAALRDDPDRVNEFMVHGALLALLGLPLGELWDLEALAAACAADGRYECLLVSAPLNFVGGAASPPNALAIR